MQGNKDIDEIYISFVTKGLSATALDKELWLCSPGGGKCCESASNIWCCFSFKFRNQGAKMRAAPLTIWLVTHLQMCTSCPCNLNSAGLGVSVPKGKMFQPGDTTMIY